MDTREILQQEAAYEVDTRLLVRSVNARLQAHPTNKDFWIRLRPPSEVELANDAKDPSLVKFNRVGSVVMIAEVLTDFIEILCAGDSLMVPLGDFFDTWIKITKWPRLRESDPPVIEVR